LALHAVVPEAVVQVAPSVLTSTFAAATLSPAVPEMVTVVDEVSVLFAGEEIVIVGGIVSGGAVGVAEASFDFGPSPTAFAALTS
jgi:hypothetical protein